MRIPTRTGTGTSTTCTCSIRRRTSWPKQIQSFIEYPPRQKPASFNLDSVLEKMQEASGGGLH